MSDQAPQIHSVYNKEKHGPPKPKEDRSNRPPKVLDMNKSYESMGSNEDEQPHYNYDSDGEPPTDQVGDKLTIVKRQQVTKTIIEAGRKNEGKPGRPYIVKVSLIGYFAPGKGCYQAEQAEGSDLTMKTKDVSETHVREPSDRVDGRGEVFVNHEDKPISLTLGDNRLPIGLWKSIEQMRRGEKSRIMIKPSWGYNSEKNKDQVFFPKGWDTEEKKEQLRKRRVFFEVQLHEWTVRHDILGNGLLIKTLHQKGRGFDRPSATDFIKADLKIYQRDNQGEKIFYEQDSLDTATAELPLTVQKILESMKQGEKISCLVQPAYYIHIDKELRAEGKKYSFPEISEDLILHIDINLLELHTITDLHQDGMTLFRTLQSGNTGSAASPFHDCRVALLLKLQIDGETTYDNFDSPETPVLYDLEAYQCPAVLRRVLKISKLEEVVEIKSKNKRKLLDHMEDKQGIFDKGKMSKFETEIIITFKLLAIEQKDHVFKLVIEDKVKRLQQLADVAAQLRQYPEDQDVYFNLNYQKKTHKVYTIIGRYYRNKDAKSNFMEEDENTLDYRNCSDQIDLIHLENFKNFAQILLDQNKFGLAFEKINDALDKIDHKDFGCNMVKIQILMAMNRYSQVQELLKDLEGWWPDKSEEIDSKREEVNAKYEEQSEMEKYMYKQMFGTNPTGEKKETVPGGVQIQIEELKKK